MATTVKPLIWRDASPIGSNYGYAITGKVLVEQSVDHDEWCVYVFTLYPGTMASLATHEGGPTDEGFHENGVEIAEGDDEWTIETWSRGRDCDGAVTSDRAGLSKGGIEDTTTHGVSGIDWGAMACRDYAAEAAGY